MICCSLFDCVLIKGSAWEHRERTNITWPVLMWRTRCHGSVISSWLRCDYAVIYWILCCNTIETSATQPVMGRGMENAVLVLGPLSCSCLGSEHQAS